VKIAEGLGYYRTLGNAAFSVSTTGVIAYQGATDDSHLVWYDRRGTTTETGWVKQNFGTVRFSPDAQSVAVDVVDPMTGTADIWIYDLSRGTSIRFTSDPDDESDPVWSPDGRRIMFRMNRGGPASLKTGSAAPNLFARTLGVTTEEELLVANPAPLNPEDWSFDGQWIAYINNTRQTATDLWMLPIGGDRKATSFAGTRFAEWGARFSPNSARLAFVSTESGAPEVYVTSVRESGQKMRVSTNGGTSPRWRRDGTALFYASLDHRTIMSVPIEWTPAFNAGIPVPLFTMQTAARSGVRGTMYDVTPDGARFLVNVPAGEPQSSTITVVQNWATELRR
jgi:dipeptidyl aminopeptidase/acylaminoacyl peptidase